MSIGVKKVESLCKIQKVVCSLLLPVEPGLSISPEFLSLKYGKYPIPEEVLWKTYKELDHKFPSYRLWCLRTLCQGLADPGSTGEAGWDGDVVKREYTGGGKRITLFLMSAWGEHVTKKFIPLKQWDQFTKWLRAFMTKRSFWFRWLTRLVLWL